MDINRIQELAQQAEQKMNVRDFESAKNLAYEIQKLGSHFFISYIVSGLLIDIGNALRNELIIKEAIDLLEKDFESIISDKRLAPSAFYNLANGYSHLFDFELIRDPFSSFFKKTTLDFVKKYYMKALEYDIQNVKLKSEIWVNLGNCFDSLGRVIDALECYEEALKCKPDHGMALGNKGIALSFYSQISGEHQGTFLIEAHALLSQALKLDIPPETENSFLRHLEAIEKLIPDKYSNTKGYLSKYPGYKIETQLEFEKFLIEFCLKYKLYLNICNFCQRCDATIGDTILIKEMTLPQQDTTFLRLSSFLNEIKQDYVTSRFLLILSSYRKLNLDFVDKRVRIIDTLDGSLHNIYVQLIKKSFKGFYDILDKIAYFLNDYLKLGISETKVDFQKIWWRSRRSRRIFKQIEDTRNPSLNALFDISQDFESGSYCKLRKTRNALTHRIVNVRRSQETEDEENMREDTLVSQTIQLAKIVRSSIIYLLYFVYIEELKKKASVKGTLVSKIAKEIPDELRK